MKRPSALSLLLVLMLAACQVQPLPVAPPPSALLDQELGQKLQAALDAAVDSPDTAWPGAVLHVRAPALGTWSGAAGLGEVATQTPMRPDDRFRAGSLTKPFVAAVVLQLVEEGRFALDDPISTVLPAEIAAKFANSDQITIRMLLNHTSGLPDFMDTVGPELVTSFGKVWVVEDFLAFAAAQDPNFAPGEAQSYSNTGYALLGIIIEKAAGRPWRDAVRRRIFEPLKLENTLLPAPEETALPGEHAHGYADFGAGVVDATELATASIVGAAGGQSLVTNASDLATFVEALLAGRLFKQSGTLDEMLTMVEFDPNSPFSVIVTDYGLGLNQISYGEGLTAIGHSGDTEGGYHGFVYHFPEQKITISGAVNAYDPSAGYFQLMPRVLEVLVPGFTLPEPPAPEQADVGAALQGLLDDQVREQCILGMIMAVRLPDGTVISGSSGYTDPAGELPWTVDTLSALGSVTKSFTAVLIMQLVKEGKLALDDTIDAWFPEQPNADKITVRMLLSHSSGLANYISGENSREPRWMNEFAPLDLVAEANRLGPVAEPGGSAGYYANTNYILLGLIVEAITGNSWADEIRSRIIEPLALEDTTFLREEGVWGGSIVDGYFKAPEGYVTAQELPSYPHYSTTWAAGEVVSTLADLMTFANALFDGKLVSKETLAEMATPLAADAQNGVVWGLGGATVEGMPGAFGMEGGIPGYSAFYIGVLDTNIVVATLINTDEGTVIAPSLAALEYLISLQP